MCLSFDLRLEGTPLLIVHTRKFVLDHCEDERLKSEYLLLSHVPPVTVTARRSI